MLSLTVAGATAAAWAPRTLAAPAAVQKAAADRPFRYSLNTSTIRGQKLSVDKEVDIAAKAGYDAIEPWIGELDEFVKLGGSLKDLGKRIADQGLTVESAIGFAEWIVDDDERRKRGLEEARRTMDLVAQIGGQRIAAPPTGAVESSGLNCLEIAKRYAELVAVGEKIGVTPQVEVWGFSKTLSRLGEVVLVALESRRAQACVLADVYHLYKGGSDFAGLKLLSGQALQVFHVNDYPAAPERKQISDADRVYPGDGIAPLGQVFRDLRAIGFHGHLSLELFNPRYWQQDALQVARTGLEKTRAVVEKSLS